MSFNTFLKSGKTKYVKNINRMSLDEKIEQMEKQKKSADKKKK